MSAPGGDAPRITRQQVDALTPDDYERGRKAVEDLLVEYRDSRLSVLRNNGLTIKEADGTPSSVIRLPTEAAVKIALQAMTEPQP